ncbi:radical SAM protein [Amaricoccus sp.]|uniref:radical SAM protein n=1 Tax=Amaricoccus sp. TaxID=1872485 RepID=UPI001B599901|nr:radical SAM protein [Amaricoccus sp.]MBP7000397.1 coproporphyrinogen dehydrogenase [Amaricoccus sp.]
MTTAVQTGEPPARERLAPRYATYPTAARFRADVGPADSDAWLAALPPGPALAARVHVPFCRQLCAFCCCRTQHARSAAPVLAYAGALVAEIGRAARLLPAGATLVAVALAGGSPTILPAPAIRALGRALDDLAPRAPDARFSVEIEPHGVARDRLDALLAIGVDAAVIGLQDLDPAVQDAIGRELRLDRVAATVRRLRAAGVRHLTIEVLYGLPRQTAASFAGTCAAAAALAPDRVVLTGYAHVPWMAKRQSLIPELSLPAEPGRAAQFAAGAAALAAAGFARLGIDLFVRAGDPLSAAAAAGALRRDLAGWLAAPVDAALGFGAASISRLPQGYVQNLAETGAYVARAAAGASATARGLALGLEDRVRGRAIEMLLAGRRIDLARLAAEFGDFARRVEPACDAAARRFPAIATLGPDLLEIGPVPPADLREIARLFDAHEG